MRMEKLFASLPAEAGVLFASVSPQPVEDGTSVEFFVRLGIARHLTEGTGKALVSKVLADEVKAGVRVFVGVYRGVSGTCRDDGASPTRPTQA